jgi:hypothetical protein
MTRQMSIFRDYRVAVAVRSVGTLEMRLTFKRVGHARRQDESMFDVERAISLAKCLARVLGGILGG